MRLLPLPSARPCCRTAPSGGYEFLSLSLPLPFPTLDLVVIPGLAGGIDSRTLVAPALDGSVLVLLVPLASPAGLVCLSILASTSSSSLARSHLSSSGSAPLTFPLSLNGSPADAAADVDAATPPAVAAVLSRLLAWSNEVVGE